MKICSPSSSLLPPPHETPFTTREGTLKTTFAAPREGCTLRVHSPRAVGVFGASRHATSPLLWCVASQNPLHSRPSPFSRRSVPSSSCPREAVRENVTHHLEIATHHVAAWSRPSHATISILVQSPHFSPATSAHLSICIVRAPHTLPLSEKQRGEERSERARGGGARNGVAVWLSRPRRQEGDDLAVRVCESEFFVLRKKRDAHNATFV